MSLRLFRGGMIAAALSVVLGGSVVVGPSAAAAVHHRAVERHHPRRHHGHHVAAQLPVRAWTDYSRPATNGEKVIQDLSITMSDGVVLDADLYEPNDGRPHPVLVELTPYGKRSPLAIQYQYLTDRGYAELIVDIRGAGTSGGIWDSFGEREQRDGYEVVEWAARQPWSDGKIGMVGPSYMALSQVLTAAQRPPHLKAIFPIVPLGDGYRDIVFSGGDLNVAFIPLWLGLVAGSTVFPSTYALSGSPADLARGAQSLLGHIEGLASFDLPTVLNGTMGGDLAYDGSASSFWGIRSPLEVADRISVPTFIVGGEHDIFQRGEPLLYERLKHHATTRLLIGPWTHLQASSGGATTGLLSESSATGTNLPADGVPPISHIMLRWFDRYLMGIHAHINKTPKVTQYMLGAGHYETNAAWPIQTLTPIRMYLRGGRALSTQAPTSTEPAQGFLQQPVSGICTQSTSQWTMGLVAALPCTTDDRPNEALGNAIYTTPPVTAPLHFNGPILANLWITTTAKDAAITVRVTDVSPSGQSTELTDGWLAASFRRVDTARSRYVNRQLLQPWHPFTANSVLPITASQATELPLEVFPTDAVIEPGHSLRITVSPADFPHAIPPVPQLADELAGQDHVLTDPQHPSYIELPTDGSTCTLPHCRPLPTPHLIRG